MSTASPELRSELRFPSKASLVMLRDFRQTPVALLRHGTRKMCQPIPAPHTRILGKVVAEWEEGPNTLVHGVYTLSGVEILVAEEVSKWAGFHSSPVRFVRKHLVL